MQNGPKRGLHCRLTRYRIRRGPFAARRNAPWLQTRWLDAILSSQGRQPHVHDASWRKQVTLASYWHLQSRQGGRRRGQLGLARNTAWLRLRFSPIHSFISKEYPCPHKKIPTGPTRTVQYRLVPATAKGDSPISCLARRHGIMDSGDVSG